MSLTTLSQFYFGITITTLNNAIDFDEGSGEIQATLNPGDYSHEEFLVEIKRAMDAVGGQAYSVSHNRTTRQITIASTLAFELLSNSGTRSGSGAWTLMGFSTAADYTGDLTYTGPNGAGSVYRPQHLLVEHVASENNVEKTDAVVNESASGRVQVIQFGTTNFIEFNIVFATNNTVRSVQSTIENQVNGANNLRTFMDYIVTKAKFEFMPNRSDANTFQKVILESTPKSRQGTAYKLEELKSAPGYFSTGKLTLRVVTT